MTRVRIKQEDQAMTSEEMELLVNTILALQSDLNICRLEMEKEVADVMENHKEELSRLETEIESKSILAELWARDNAELFRPRRSIELGRAVVGFQLTPHKVEKRRSTDKMGDLILKLQRLPWGRKYVRTPEPQLNKDALIADRSELTESQLKEAGFKITQKDKFYITGKDAAQLEQGVVVA